MKAFVDKDKAKEIGGSTVFEVAGTFVLLSFESILIGLFFGLVPTLMTKHCRYHSHSAIIESSLLICFAMMSYFLSEMLEFSAIASLLVTTLVMSHYCWYNLSP